MIGKQEILERAGESHLRPEVVEKDYILGWLLAAVARHATVSEQWVLKGGTCVKKCFFDTYRFSEDLDFSLVPDAEYSPDGIRRILDELAESASAMSGLRVSRDQIIVKGRRDKFGRLTFEGRIGYQGPLAIPTWPRILFDLTQHEPIVTATTRREVLHPYSDGLPSGVSVQTYAFEELLAEKARALFERTRPRDLYDVAFILDNLETSLNAELVRSIFAQKCRIKEFEPPDAAALLARVRASEELRADWNAMLVHQLPFLVPVDGALDRLERALDWLTAVRPVDIIGTSARLASAPLSATGGEVAPRSLRSSALDQLRFAGANRLLVTFLYNGKVRVVEPYSLRWAKTTGNLNFYGWELASLQIKCFTVARMTGLRSMERIFVPRFHVELGAPGEITRGAWKW